MHVRDTNKKAQGWTQCVRLCVCVFFFSSSLKKSYVVLWSCAYVARAIWRAIIPSTLLGNYGTFPPSVNRVLYWGLLQPEATTMYVTTVGVMADSTKSFGKEKKKKRRRKVMHSLKATLFSFLLVSFSCYYCGVVVVVFFFFVCVYVLMLLLLLTFAIILEG